VIEPHPQRIVVVGGGLTAGKAAARLRALGWDGQLTIVTDEPHPPYERPPLSKDLMLDLEKPGESTYLQPEAWYADHEVDLRTSTTVTGIDLADCLVRTEDSTLPFDRLLLATGSRARRLPPGVVSGATGQTIAYLRTIEDSLRIREHLIPGASVVMIGGGWISMEVAAAARTAGCDVTVLERGELPLLRVLGHEVAERFAELHRSHGVDLRVQARVASVQAAADGARVVLENGDPVVADLVVVGIGAEPNSELAEAAGLAVRDGVITDRFLRTASRRVYAAGDVATVWTPRYGDHVRVEHWDNAIHQGELAASNMVGVPTPYDRVPYFFTDQFELGMEFVGHLDPRVAYKTVIRGDLASDSFVVFWLHDQAVAAAMHVNDWDSTAALRTLVETGAPAANLELLADPHSDLAQLVRGAQPASDTP
jgi:3-phenylpropionate/trans-cinnamate dioxygenase ferredoxin reductase subunit